VATDRERAHLERFRCALFLGAGVCIWPLKNAWLLGGQLIREVYLKQGTMSGFPMEKKACA